MTEQPFESPTEQEWLGHRRPDADGEPRTVTSIQPSNAQRVAPQPLTPPANLHPAPVISLSRPFEVAQVAVLMRRAITAAAKLQRARDAAERAETALSEAVAAEKLAEIDAVNAETALIEFAREAAAE